MKEFDKEIKDIMKKIEEQFPEKMEALIKTRLIEADKNKELLAINESEMVNLKKKMEEIEHHAIVAGEEIIELEKKLEYAGDLIKREREVREKEITQEVEMLKHELSCANNTNQKIIGFVDSLMRNTVFRENTFKNIQDQYNNNSGAYDKVETGESKDKTAE